MHIFKWILEIFYAFRFVIIQVMGPIFVFFIPKFMRVAAMLWSYILRSISLRKLRGQTNILFQFYSCWFNIVIIFLFWGETHYVHNMTFLIVWAAGTIKATLNIFRRLSHDLLQLCLYQRDLFKFDFWCRFCRSFAHCVSKVGQLSSDYITIVISIENFTFELMVF